MPFSIAGSHEPEPIPVPMSTDLKFVEFEIDGKPCSISVYDRIDIVSKVFYILYAIKLKCSMHLSIPMSERSFVH